MRLLLVGDLHLRSKNPEGRIDDFRATQMRKVKQILAIAQERKCGTILQAGDFFDSPNPANGLLADYITLLHDALYVPEEQPTSFCAVLGQHDYYLGSDVVERTALNVLNAAGVVRLLANEPVKPVGVSGGDGMVCGCSFGQSVPRLRRGARGAFNVLVIHASIGYPLFAGQSISDPERFLVTYPEYNLVLCGDYHYPFGVELDGRWIINAGAVARLSRSKRDQAHEPGVVFFDTEDPQNWERVRLDVEPSEKVFDLTAVEEREDRAEALSGFIAALREGGVGVDFWSNLERYYERENIPEHVRRAVAVVAEELEVGREQGRTITR